MSSNFGGSTTRDLNGLSREIESRLSHLELKGAVQTKWGRVEIQFDPSKESYHTVAINSKNSAQKVVKEHGDFKTALNYAHQTARAPDFNQAAQLKHLDVFTDDFSPPGTSESSIGQDNRKENGGYGKPHEDYSSDEDNSKNHSPRFRSLAAAGKASDQAPMDKIDKEEQILNGGIKPESSQFPGAKRMAKYAGHNFEIRTKGEKTSQRFQAYSTEANINTGWLASKAEAIEAMKYLIDEDNDSEMSSSDGPESFNKEVEKRMARLEKYYGKHKGISFEIISEGGGFSWKIGKSRGGQVYKTENTAIDMAKKAIEQGVGR